MARNKLTPEQDVLTREFFIGVAAKKNTLDDHPGLKRQLVAILLELLNYDTLVDGRFITKGTKVKMPYMGLPSPEEYPDEWEADARRALNEVDRKEQITNEGIINNPIKTDSGEQAKSASLWKALFPKDV